MKSSIRPRVLKGNAVEVNLPRLVENNPSEFHLLSEHIPVVRDPEGETFERAGAAPVESAPEVAALQEEAEAKAQQVIKQAQAEAEELRSRTYAELEGLKLKALEEAQQAGYQKGYEQGVEQGSAQGYNEGFRQGQGEAENLVGEAEQVLVLARNALREEYSRVDQDLLRMAIRIAEQILRTSLKLDPQLLLERLQALIVIPHEPEGLKLYVSPQDAEWLTRLPEERKPQVVFLRDDKLQPGDCYLESREGIHEARLQDQLQRFEELLREELLYGGLVETQP